MTKGQEESKPGGSTRILVVDDHPIVRQGLKELVEQQPDLSICGEAENTSQALQAAAASQPDIAIVDVFLQDSNGLELVKALKARYPGLPVLVLSMHDESLYAERVLRAGARGYVMKEEATDKLMTAIRKVSGGDIYLSERMGARLMSKFVHGAPEAGGSPMEQLSDRELQVFELIGQGQGTRQIAQTLHVSVKTIDSHREHIKTKLGLANSAELTRHAIQWVQFERSN